MALGLGVRIAYLVVVHPHVQGLSDAGTNHLAANLLASGHGLIRPYDYIGRHVVRPSAEFPPLFTFLLGGVAALGGTSLLAQRLAMCVVGTLTVGATGLLGRRVAGERAVVPAAALAAVHPLLFGS